MEEDELGWEVTPGLDVTLAGWEEVLGLGEASGLKDEQS